MSLDDYEINYLDLMIIGRFIGTIACIAWSCKSMATSGFHRVYTARNNP